MRPTFYPDFQHENWEKGWPQSFKPWLACSMLGWRDGWLRNGWRDLQWLFAPPPFQGGGWEGVWFCFYAFVAINQQNSRFARAAKSARAAFGGVGKVINQRQLHLHHGLEHQLRNAFGGLYGVRFGAVVGQNH